MYTVQDVMTREVICLSEQDDLALAENIMYFGRFRHLPVLRDGKLVGLVSHRDFLEALAKVGPSSGRTLQASEVMTSPVEHVTPATRFKVALRLMLKKRYGCLPVLGKHGEVVGILTETDVTRFAARLVADLEAVERGLARVAEA